MLGHPTELVVVTGGEPLLQQDLLAPLVQTLVDAGRRVEVETNGTVVPSQPLAGTVTRFNVSPKLAGFAATGDAQRRVNPEALRALGATGRAVFKFVATGLDDLDEVAELQRRFDLHPVWVMPEATAAGTLLDAMRRIAEEVVARGWNLSTRLHVLLWGDARGR
ncbi:MAG: hypothetical protein ACRDT6_18980 [Micromonosporaceae bacterium]